MKNTRTWAEKELEGIQPRVTKAVWGTGLVTIGESWPDNGDIKGECNHSYNCFELH